MLLTLWFVNVENNNCIGKDYKRYPKANKGLNRIFWEMLPPPSPPEPPTDTCSLQNTEQLKEVQPWRWVTR